VAKERSELLSKAFEEASDGIWPCKECGADQAPNFIVDDKNFVVECANCGMIADDMHIDSDRCWCHPKPYYNIDGIIWIHNMKH
jgi:rubrerythrin